MSFEKAVKLAIDRNIIVFDCDAGTGRISIRLLALMRAIQRRENKDFKLKHIYIHEIHVADFKEALIINPRILNIYCVQFIDVNLTEIYKSDPTVSIPFGKEFMILAEFENVKNNQLEFLLGSF